MFPVSRIKSNALVTARKRSLGQGSIFRSVCQEFCSQGGCLVPGGWGGVPGPRGVPGPGGCLVLGGAWSRGVPGLGGSQGPQPRGKLRGIWSRLTTKGAVEGDLVQAHTQGGS